MRAICAALLATTLVVSNAIAATEPDAPLPSGKPAGVEQAAMLGPNLFLVLLGAGIVIGGLTIAISNNGGSKGVTSGTTTTTRTSGLP